jgi:N-acylneuraminate cytidylyltransferase
MRRQAFIFARGGSKGVPGKNIRPLAGKPLIVFAIETALSAPSLGDVIVSTDDEAIADVARRWGARVPFMRPPELASDTASEWHAWRHALEWAEANEGPLDAMISLPTTAPFRTVADVEACAEMLERTPAADAVITVAASERNPYFNMVTLDPEKAAGLVIPPTREAARRQDAPPVYDITTVAYAVRPGHIRQHSGLFDGSVYAVEIPRERALDIDTPYDFKIAELLAGAGWPEGTEPHS